MVTAQLSLVLKHGAIAFHDIGGERAEKNTFAPVDFKNLYTGIHGNILLAEFFLHIHFSITHCIATIKMKITF